MPAGIQKRKNSLSFLVLHSDLRGNNYTNQSLSHPYEKKWWGILLASECQQNLVYKAKEQVNQKH